MCYVKNFVCEMFQMKRYYHDFELLFSDNQIGKKFSAQK